MKFQNGFAHAFIIVGIIAFLIGVLGVVFWKQFIGPNANQQLSTSDQHNDFGKNDQNQSSSDRSTDKEIPTSWASYTGGMPISFRYPSAWQIIEIPGSSGRIGAIRAVNGPKSSTESLALAILYRKDATTKVPSVCSVNLPDDIKSCEQYPTKQMIGVIDEYKTGTGYEYTSYIGKDLYSVISYNRFASKETFKKILQSIEPKG